MTDPSQTQDSPAETPADDNPNINVDPTQDPDAIDWLGIEKYVWQHVTGAEALYHQLVGSPLVGQDPMLSAALSNHIVQGYQAVASIRLVRLLEKNGVKGLQGIDFGKVVTNLQQKVDDLEGEDGGEGG